MAGVALAALAGGAGAAGLLALAGEAEVAGAGGKRSTATGGGAAFTDVAGLEAGGHVDSAAEAEEVAGLDAGVYVGRAEVAGLEAGVYVGSTTKGEAAVAVVPQLAPVATGCLVGAADVTEGAAQLLRTGLLALVGLVGAAAPEEAVEAAVQPLGGAVVLLLDPLSAAVDAEAGFRIAGGEEVLAGLVAALGTAAGMA